MGFLSWLFGKRKNQPEPVEQRAIIEEESREADERVAPFDPEVTMFVSPKLPVTAQQALRKLRLWSDAKVKQYNWLCGDDCAGVCRQVQDEGPYMVQDALAGIAPVPGMGAYRDCECTVAAVAEE